MKINSFHNSWQSRQRSDYLGLYNTISPSFPTNSLLIAHTAPTYPYLGGGSRDMFELPHLPPKTRQKG